MEAQKRNLRARKRATLEQAGVPRQTRLCFQVSPSPVPNHPVSSNRPCCSAVARPTTFRGSWRCSIPCSLLPPHLLDHPHDIPLLSCLPSLPLLTPPSLFACPSHLSLLLSLPLPLSPLSPSLSPAPGAASVPAPPSFRLLAASAIAAAPKGRDRVVGRSRDMFLKILKERGEIGQIQKWWNKPVAGGGGACSRG